MIRSHSLRSALVCGLALTLLIATSGPSFAQPQPTISVGFDEIGSIPCTTICCGALDVYVVAHDLDEIAGYEFELVPTFLPAFFLGKILYAAEPLTLDLDSTDYEVRAATYGCITDPTQMGPSPWSWTLVNYQLGYFSGIPNDTWFCLFPAPSSGASTPEYRQCDPERTPQPLYPHPMPWDPVGFAPEGCAIANPTEWGWYDCGQPIEAPQESWGTLKSQYATGASN